MSKTTATEDLLAGIWKQNPVFVTLLGLCPTLAVTNSVANAIGMGAATFFVLLGSNVLVSAAKRWIPREVRIAAYIMIIATFVTICDLFLKAFQPKMSEILGAYVPLIIVNCLIIFRAEARASKSGPLVSVLDGIGMGMGFTLALCFLAGIRELLATGRIFEIPVMPKVFVPWLAMQMPVGAFVTLGLILGLINVLTRQRPVTEEGPETAGPEPAPEPQLPATA